MNEDVFNTSLRGFLKKVGITSQREIEKAVRDAVAAGQNGADARRRQPDARGRRRDRTGLRQARRSFLSPSPSPLVGEGGRDAKHRGRVRGLSPRMQTPHPA